MARPAIIPRMAIVGALAVPLVVLSLWPRERDAAADSPKTGSIVGKVTLAGDAPKREPLERDTDPVCARTPRLSEDVVTGKGGALRDVHVRIAVGSAGTHAPPGEPVRVTQTECMYTPRVVGVMEGQGVAIENGDPTYHNVRGAHGKRTLWNLGQPPKAPAIVRENLGKAGEVVSLHCDVHPWMRAYAVITDHPYFAVTGEDGAFTIANVPAGRYTLEAWHPTLGLQKETIEVEAGVAAKTSFRFAAAKP